MGNEFVAVLDVSVLATGEGVGESDAGVGVIGIDVLNVFGEGAPPALSAAWHLLSISLGSMMWAPSARMFRYWMYAG